jgi:signal transduction histidine kinase
MWAVLLAGSERGSAPAGDARIAALCRLAFNFRLVVLTLTVVALFDSDHRSTSVAAGIIVAAVMTVLPILRWESIGPALMHHPLFLGLDLVAAMILLAFTGAGSPLYSYTLGVALLAGVLHGNVGALVFSPFLVIGYFAGVASADGAAISFQTLLGLPALYPVAALSGAAVRRLIERQIRTETELRTVVAAAEVERERTRIAREMHDSVAKTLHGMSLHARAAAAWVRKDPQRALDELAALEHAAAAAAREGRRLIEDLRTDALEVPFKDVVRTVAERWGHKSGVDTQVEARAESEPSPDTRWELLQILREALANIERHSDARRARVTLTEAGGAIKLAVTDDGRGLDEEDAARRRADGHYGLVGMEERARRAGGSLAIVTAPGEGTTITAHVPAAIPQSQEPSAHRDLSPA